MNQSNNALYHSDVSEKMDHLPLPERIGRLFLIVKDREMSVAASPGDIYVTLGKEFPQSANEAMEPSEVIQFKP